MSPESIAFDERVATHYEAWYETPPGQRVIALEEAALQRLLQRDTVVTTRFFGARDRSLDEIRAAVSALDGRVRRSSRWLHAVSAVVSTAGLRRASTSREFRHLQPVARFRGRPRAVT